MDIVLVRTFPMDVELPPALSFPMLMESLDSSPLEDASSLAAAI